MEGKVFVNAKAEHSLKEGHPWVYGEEVVRAEGCENGTVVGVYTQKARYLGAGFYNEHSKIRVRVLSRNANDRFDEAFWERRLRYALEYRKTVMPGDDFSCCRLIFGEADQFPGLTVDRFGSVLVAQVLSLGMEQRREVIFPLLVRLLREMGEHVDVLYERNDVALREKEGLPQCKRFFAGEGLLTETDGITHIRENGIEYTVDYINGQKTGFFLDQKYNRAAVASLARGKHVLDCFTHTGSFALNAAAGGAADVTAVDISADAIAMAKKNAQQNGLKMEFLCEDVFELLTRLAKEKTSRYDFIILDPPAFTKSSTTVKNAYAGYKEINLKAMKILPRGGYLATCSCSHFMPEGMFKKMLHEAAADAGVSLRQIQARQQAQDHPILWNVQETEYLKFFLFQVV